MLKGVGSTMKKIILASSLVLTSIVLPVQSIFASEGENVVSELEKIDIKYDEIELVEKEAIPSNVEEIKFESVEAFEKFLELNKEKEIKESIPVVNEINDVSVTEELEESTNDTIASISKPVIRNGAVQLTVVLAKVAKFEILPMQPFDITADIKYTYTGSKSTSKFKSIKRISSYSLGVPTNWRQTSYAANLTNKNKTVAVTMNGYHLLGVNIAGQSVGIKSRGSFKFKYTINGSKLVMAYK